MLRKILMMTLVAVISCTVLAGALYASDLKRYPGSMCLASGYADENYWMLNDLGRLVGNFYNESSTEEQWVFCPIMTDEITYYTASVTVNNYASEEFLCVLNSFDPETGNGWQSAGATTTTSGIQTLSFNVSSDTAYDRSIHSILCIVPPKSRILRYDIYEDGVDPS